MTAQPQYSTDRRSTPDPQDLKARVDCRDVARTLWGAPVRETHSRNLYPQVSQEHTPSVWVYADHFVNYGTGGDSGDVFSLIRYAQDCDFPTALTWLIDYTGGRSLPAPRPPSVKRDAPTQPPSTSWQAQAAELIAASRSALWQAPKALDYLRGRGLSDETIRTAQLGYAPDSTMAALFPTLDGRAGAIVIPWFVDGQVWAVKFRRSAGDPKYIQLAGGNQANALYNADAIRAGLPVFIVEGEFDVLVAQQLAGDLAVFVTLGSASNRLSQRWVSTIADKKVVLALDNDQAGREATEKIAASLSAVSLASPLSESAKDITDYVLADGDLRAWVSAALVQEPVLISTVNQTPDLRDSRTYAPVTWSGGLPSGARAALGKYADAPVAPYLEFRFEAVAAGLADVDEALTIADLVDLAKSLGRDVSEATIRRGAKLVGDYFLATCHPIKTPEQDKESDNPIGQVARKSARCQKSPGPSRPAQTYILPTPDQVIAGVLRLAGPRIVESEFPDDNPTVAPLRELFDDLPGLVDDLEAVYGAAIAGQPEIKACLDRARLQYKRLEKDLRKADFMPLPAGWKYRNGVEYTACIARALVEKSGGTAEYSRQELADALGRSPRHVGSVLDRAGVKVEKRTVEEPVGTFADFQEVKPVYDQHAQGFPVRVVATRTDDRFSGRRFSPQDADLRAWVKAELEAGSDLTIVYQQRNRQVIASAGQPDPKPRLKRAMDTQQDATVDPGNSRQEPADLPQDNATLPRARESVSTRRPYFGPRHDPLWRDTGRAKLLALVTSWERRDGDLLDRDTGEMQPYNPETVVKLLLERAGVQEDRAMWTPTEDLIDEEIVPLVRPKVTAIVDHASAISAQIKALADAYADVMHFDPATGLFVSVFSPEEQARRYRDAYCAGQEGTFQP